MNLIFSIQSQVWWGGGGGGGGGGCHWVHIMPEFYVLSFHSKTYFYNARTVAVCVLCITIMYAECVCAEVWMNFSVQVSSWFLNVPDGAAH